MDLSEKKKLLKNLRVQKKFGFGKSADIIFLRTKQTTY